MLDEYRVVEQPAARYGLQTALDGTDRRLSAQTAGSGVYTGHQTVLRFCCAIRIAHGHTLQKHDDRSSIRRLCSYPGETL